MVHRKYSGRVVTSSLPLCKTCALGGRFQVRNLDLANVLSLFGAFSRSKTERFRNALLLPEVGRVCPSNLWQCPRVPTPWCCTGLLRRSIGDRLAVLGGGIREPIGLNDAEGRLEMCVLVYSSMGWVMQINSVISLQRLLLSFWNQHLISPHVRVRGGRRLFSLASLASCFLFFLCRCSLLV